MDNTQLLKNMQQLRKKIEKKAEGVKVIDITFYGQIEIMNPKTKKREVKKIYSVEKMELEQRVVEMYADNEQIATVLFDKENQIEIVPKFRGVIQPEMLLAKLEELKEQGIEQISQEKLEEIEEQRQERGVGARTQPQKKQKVKPKEQEEEKDEEKQEEQKKNEIGKNDIEIDMNQYVVAGKKLADIIPELKQKNVKRCKIRTNDNIHFEVYGIDAGGNKVELTSLSQTEGTNPSQEMIKTNLDGTEVESIRVSTMLKINSNTNEKRGNQGLGIRVGSLGIAEVVYYRRDQNNHYLSIPVGLKTTNDKKTTREVRELLTKQYNTDISNDIERAEERLEDGTPTQIENIDDNFDNNVIDDIEIQKIIEAAKRNKMSVEGFLEIYQDMRGDTIEERIEKTEDEIGYQERQR